jgi:hypothetical protein
LATTTLSNLTTAEPRPHKPPDPRRKPPHLPENSIASSTIAKPVSGQKTENEKQSTKTEEAKRKQLSTEKHKKNESKGTRRPKYTWGSSQNDEEQGEPKQKHKEKRNTEKPEQEGGRTTKNASENARSKSTSERRR